MGNIIYCNILLKKKVTKADLINWAENHGINFDGVYSIQAIQYYLYDFKKDLSDFFANSMNTTGKKYGGRKKGTPNKEVKDIREAFQVLIENNLDKMDLWINQLAEKNPEKAINTILRLSDFILPKLTKTEITQLPKDEYANMTDEELDAEIKKNIEKMGYKIRD